MSEKSGTGKLLVAGVTGLVLGSAAAFFVFHGPGGGGGGGVSPTDDPPIIVSDGSIIFQGGDEKNPGKGKGKWAPPDSASSQHWREDRADNATAFDVNSFTVYIAGVADAGCTQTTMAGNSVEVDYSTGLVFYITPGPDASGKHQVPHLDGKDSSSTLSPGNTSASYPQLVADANGKGYISQVTVTSASGTAPVCKLPPPDDAHRQFVRISIVSEQ